MLRVGLRRVNIAKELVGSRPSAEHDSEVMSHAPGETFRPAFSDRQIPRISFGVLFSLMFAQNMWKTTFNASRICIIASKSLSANTNALKRLENVLEVKV